ncbi:MAG: hypoxanthine phosphoribosyltransferase [Rikenellaceae bacterium]
MKERVKLHDKSFKPMISAAEIAQGVAKVAGGLNEKFAGKEAPIIMGVLNGAFIFLSDVVRSLDFRCEVSFIKIASYEGTESSGAVRELIGISSDITGRDIVIVEDIVDSGKSIEYLCQTLREAGARSVTICTLFLKPAAYVGCEKIDFAAFEIGNEFIVGYGLDYDQYGRELADVYVVEE